ncbi:UNVERIFIED_CONTAM: hypothetical protein NCL1_30400 [Trichonephila clavipes]
MQKQLLPGHLQVIMALMTANFLFRFLICTLILLYCSPFLSFSDDTPASPKVNRSRFLSSRSLLHTLVGPLEDFDVIQHQNSSFIQQGIAMPFCNLFGCKTSAAPNLKCDKGYRFDEDAKRCRLLVNDTTILEIINLTESFNNISLIPKLTY